MLEQLLHDVKGAIPEPLWNVLVLIVGISVAIWTLIRSFVFVQPGHVGIRMRFGKPILAYKKTDPNTGRVYTKEEIASFKAFDKAEIQAFRPAKYGRPKYLYPGFNALIPLMHSVRMVNIQINNISLGDLRIDYPQDYIAHDLPEATINILIPDPYLWMIASADAEAQIKAISDTQLGTMLRRFSIDEVLDSDSRIQDEFQKATASEFEPLGATFDSLKLGTKLPSIDPSYAARSRREIAEAIAGGSRNHAGISGVRRIIQFFSNRHEPY
jgi:regulator of protease activity HflC (stomatin/prohibitin superfamily)